MDFGFVQLPSVGLFRSSTQQEIRQPCSPSYRACITKVAVASPETRQNQRKFVGQGNSSFFSSLKPNFTARAVSNRPSFSLVTRCDAEDVPAEVREKIDNLVKSNKILLFMKGNRLMPMCGFSNTVVQILNRTEVPYETCDILNDPDLRQYMKDYSNWPTFPQVYINGEFIGGCDIMIDMFQSGELATMLEVALGS
uniref:Glutaredoxin domain-containing protein n=1 Tax=Cyanoptyche gloeocystis TaxID=77922 RepID=A0A7S2JLN0_9EUKA|mmetsp:Transcript_2155/g.4020  ORF Transcript_2155/g.4020 Transcript_2155/m.4020 type:complete len:196 (+) Transcript_2155:71-658(+)